MLYLYLKQQVKTKEGHRGPFNKKRKTYKDNNKLNNPIGLIIHFRITVNNNTGNFLHI
jgi:hypothetical protein